MPKGEFGFGYDPIFLVGENSTGADRTMAQLTDSEKDVVSHRGVAARLFLDWLLREGIVLP
jgi:XTP/dITP diphosphohydrolase